MARDVTSRSITFLKSHARRLHRQAQGGEARALERLRRLPEFKGADDRSIASGVLRRHALDAVARDTGFATWPHALGVLSGKETGDFGTLLYPSRHSTYWNIWSARYDEAKSIRAGHGGYLLAWRNQFLVVDEHFIANLGLDPDDEGWDRMGRDWARPADLAARDRFYCTLVRRAVGAA